VATLNDDVRLVFDVAVSGFVPNNGLAPKGRAVVFRVAVQLGLFVLNVPLKFTVMRPKAAVPPGATVTLVGGVATETLITLPSVNVFCACLPDTLPTAVR
jgi:hypothetical protein